MGKFTSFQSRKSPEKMILKALKMYMQCISDYGRGGTLVPNGVKVAVKTYRLLSCLYQKIESILTFLKLF